ncbi:hypothetical protein JCM19055_4989 [Geomicrobium sp. JCM 19055]|nr:hypothetical protein JCM19055_4989 [Geomicrobium sp. JCM 19055]
MLGRLKASSFTREKEQRTSLQVLANGGVAAVAALLVPFFWRHCGVPFSSITCCCDK